MWGSNSGQTLHLRRNEFPIDQILKEIGQIVRALVSEINIVGMFPHIASEQCRLSKTKRIHTVFGFGDLQSTTGSLLNRPMAATNTRISILLLPTRVIDDVWWG